MKKLITFLMMAFAVAMVSCADDEVSPTDPIPPADKTTAEQVNARLVNITIPVGTSLKTALVYTDGSAQAPNTIFNASKKAADLKADFIKAFNAQKDVKDGYVKVITDVALSGDHDDADLDKLANAKTVIFTVTIEKGTKPTLSGTLLTSKIYTYTVGAALLKIDMSDVLKDQTKMALEITGLTPTKLDKATVNKDTKTFTTTELITKIDGYVEGTAEGEIKTAVEALGNAVTSGNVRDGIASVVVSQTAAPSVTGKKDGVYTIVLKAMDTHTFAGTAGDSYTLNLVLAVKKDNVPSTTKPVPTGHINVTADITAENITIKAANKAIAITAVANTANPATAAVAAELSAAPTAYATVSEFMNAIETELQGIGTIDDSSTYNGFRFGAATLTFVSATDVSTGTITAASSISRSGTIVYDITGVTFGADTVAQTVRVTVTVTSTTSDDNSLTLVAVSGIATGIELDAGNVGTKVSAVAFGGDSPDALTILLTPLVTDGARDEIILAFNYNGLGTTTALTSQQKIDFLAGVALIIEDTDMLGAGATITEIKATTVLTDSVPGVFTVKVKAQDGMTATYTYTITVGQNTTAK